MAKAQIECTGKYLDSDSDSEIDFTEMELKEINDYFKNKMNKAAGYSQQTSFISEESSDADQPNDAWSKIEHCFSNEQDEIDHILFCIADDDWEEFGTFTLDPKVAERLNGFETYCTF